MNQAGERTEYMLEGLLVSRDEPDENATWDPWGTHPSMDDPTFLTQLQFLRQMKEQARSGGAQGQTRILDYRILRRTVFVSEWEEVDDELGRDA